MNTKLNIIMALICALGINMLAQETLTGVDVIQKVYDRPEAIRRAN